MTPKVNNINFVRGDTFSENITIKNCIDEITEIYFTVKANYDDKTPVIRKTLTGGGINLIDEQEKSKTYNLLINATDTDGMKTNIAYVYDIELVSETTKITLLNGTLTLNPEVTTTSEE